MKAAVFSLVRRVLHLLKLGSLPESAGSRSNRHLSVVPGSLDQTENLPAVVGDRPPVIEVRDPTAGVTRDLAGVSDQAITLEAQLMMRNYEGFLK